MMRSNIPVWRQAALALLLAVALGGLETAAQEAARADCPFRTHKLAGYINGDSPWLAQLDQQPEGSDSGLGRGWAGDQVRKRGYDRARDRFRQQGRHRFGKHIEQFRILKLLELLDLREDQELEFITAFHSMRRERRQLHEKRISLVEELADGLRTETVPDMEINRLIREISKLGNQQERVMEDFLGEAQKILTPSQLGRFIVFHERFEFELLEAVKAFRERQPPPSKPPPMEEPGR